MELDEECVDSMWNLLKGAIQQILKKDNKDLCFTELYKIAHTLLHQRRAMKMYTGLEEILREHLMNDVKQPVSVCLIKLTTWTFILPF